MKKNNMKKNTRNLIIATSLSFGFVGLGAVTAFADSPEMYPNDNIEYNLTVPGDQKNDITEDRYRETNNEANTWKVELVSSGETGDSNSACTFWLENTSNENVSNSTNVREGQLPEYTTAYWEANETYVHMAVQNDQYNSQTFSISGFWDEETW